MKNARGVTLIELLIVAIISSIAMLALAAPFVTERRISIGGWRQTEAQRDAQIALRAMARAARESNGYIIAAANDMTFTDIVTGCSSRFQGGPSQFFWDQQFLITKTCGIPNGGQTITTTALIDGVRSQVTSLTFTEIGTNKKLVQVQLGVTHEAEGNETLQTELHLRNAS